MTKQMIVNHNFKAICVVMGWSSECVARWFNCPVRAIQKLNTGEIQLTQTQYYTLLYMIEHHSPVVKYGDQKLKNLLEECTDDY